MTGAGAMGNVGIKGTTTNRCCLEGGRLCVEHHDGSVSYPTVNWNLKEMRIDCFVITTEALEFVLNQMGLKSYQK
jgi:hypothetical protein